jgi:putative MATE family efflux protein
MGSEPIPKLLLEFSLPVMTGMIVQAIYNVVNRAFIGNAPEAATLGMAAITVGMPLMLVCMAFGGLVGFGGAAALSIYLGEGDTGRSERALGNGFALAVLIGLGLTLAGLAFLDPLLALCGATADVLPYAREYNRLILIGSVPMTVSFAMTNFIRAEGNPGRSMRIMIASAVCNVALDALFIVGLHMGVLGAALGTVLSQSLAVLLVLHYYASRASHVRFRFANLALDPAIVRRCLGLGSSAFILHVGNSFLQFVLNGQMARYGGDVALAAWGIVQSVGLFFLFPIFGINGGSQPLIGYNYGAGRFARVKRAAKWAILGASGVALLAFGAIQLAARGITGLFSGDDRALLELSAFGLRIVYLLLPAIGFQIVAASYFTAVGKPLKAMLLTLSRQLLFLVPLAFLLPRFLGLDGLFVAVPVADGLAAIVTLVFFVREMRGLGRGADSLPARVVRSSRT